MKDKQEFFHLLTEIDGREVADYSRIIGDFDFSRYILKVIRVPQEGENALTLFVVRVPQTMTTFPAHYFNTPIRRTALEDLLTRKVAAHTESLAHYDEEGISRRRLMIASPGQKILPRSSMVIQDEHIEARLYVQLPARRGRILGDAAKDIFFNDLPGLVNATLIYNNLDEAEVAAFVNLMEDADQVRQALPTRGLISFVGEGSLLSRLDQSDMPDYHKDVPFSVADEHRIEIDVANAGTIRGLGIPTGITVIVGDDYSGRIELMKALAAGIYNHVPGDGREMIITTPDAVYVAAERGRSVQRVNISPFVRQTRGGADVKSFTCRHADACASQAAATVESLEVGARALLFDESDSAPGFLALDGRLAGITPSDESHVIPLSVRARQIVDELGVSIVVAGGTLVAEFIPVADTVLQIRNFRVTDVTKAAKQIGLQPVFGGGETSDIAGLLETSRWVVPSSIDPSVGREDAKIEAMGMHRLQFGRTTIDLQGIEQMADSYQTATIGLILYYGRQHYLDEARPIREILDLVDRDLSTEGLECLTRELRGDMARPRRYEIAAVLNRLSALRIARPEE